MGWYCYLDVCKNIADLEYLAREIFVRVGNLFSLNPDYSTSNGTYRAN